MANPDNALGTNAAFGGRTSINAFNDVLSAFSGRGILSGWECVPNGGLTAVLGGVEGTRDVAIAEDANGNKTTVNNISQGPITVTLDAAPASNSRIDAIVAYIENPPRGNAVTDNYDAVNLLVVDGVVGSSPSVPDDSAVRTAITADGASGATAYYVVLATVRIAAGTTDIDATMISAGSAATVKIADGAITADKIDFETFASASIAVGDPLGTVSVANDCLVVCLGRIQNATASASDYAYTFSMSGASGQTFTPLCQDFGTYARTWAIGMAFCRAGDSVTISESKTGSARLETAYSARLIIPCNW